MNDRGGEEVLIARRGCFRGKAGMHAGILPYREIGEGRLQVSNHGGFSRG